ncbi:MAG TPA: glycosyltransferase family 2 protein [Euryarchaeota archaeon]|nr:undecaprenyl-phosphate mannosyltransferase [archaeon BMS3Abin16]GBE55994.1 undecaprenyl-phosphate mannosyltransferase [archaeon BMS3Bbin16]HDH28110.1 glycosyltransferase family 2 protein [Euryarchaeota archaeon]HDY74544.1 glycosyltransferase family 2 protein [Euryarchaeota archaeon]
MKSAAVIPSYNVGKTIGDVVSRTSQFVDQVFVVDDGSTDETAVVARRSGAEVISLDVNTGKANATRVGIKKCSGYDAVVLLDGDLQHCPEEIPALISEVQSGAHLCIGSRFLNDTVGMPFGNRLSNRMASKIISTITGQTVTDPQSGFRALEGGVAQELELAAEGYAIEHIMILEAAKKSFIINEVPISCIYGDEESNVRVLTDSYRVMRDIIRFVLR